MDYLITSFNFKDNTLIFNSEFRITELYLNDQQLPLTTKTDKSYAVDFTYLPISQLVFGRFHILAKVGEKLVRLKNTDFENVPESDRYFSVNGIPGAFVYLTINGYLNFSYLSSSSYLRIVERSYDNFDYETRDIEIQHFEISDNLVTLTKIPKFSEVVIMSQKDKEEYTVPFVRENGITKIDFSSLLNLGIDRYFVFLKIAEKNIRVRYTDVLKLDVQKRYFELKKKYSVLHPNFNKTQNYLYFSVNGRLAFIKSPQKNFKWNNYTGTIEAEILKFDLLSNNLSIQFTDLLEDDYSLELRDGQKVIELYPTEKSSDKLNFNFNDTSIDLKAKYLVSLKSINKNNELYNYLLRINHERDGKVLTKDYTVSQFSEQRLLYLMFNDRQFFYTKEKIIIAKSKFINKNTIIIVPETYVFDSIPKIIAQSRSSSIMHQLLVEKEGNDFIVNIDDINRIRQHEIFDIYCLIGDEKYSFKNLDALKTPVSRRYQELEVDDYRLSLYSTLSGTLAFRKDEINEENRQLYKYRTDDLTISSIESNDEYIEFDLPDKVFDVIEVSLLPRKGTDLKDELSFEIEGETNKIKIFNLSKVRASQTKKIFNYFADYLLTWSDKKGSIHTSYLKAMNFELIEKPLRKFKPYNPRTEKYVLVQNYLNAAHNLSVQLKNLYYAENYERVSIDNNLVLYESRDGKSFVDSPLNIFQYLISHKQYKKLKHVVVFDDLDGEAAQYNQKKYGDEIILVERDTEQYANYLLTAKYLINNSTFQSYFLKRDEQIYINTWHGTPLKLMGMDMPYPVNASQNVLRNLLMTDYVVAQNDRMYDMYTKSYRMDGIYSGHITKFGYPRMDSLVNKIREDSGTLADFGIKINDDLPTILYAPTHNGQNQSSPGEGVLNVIDDLVRLRSYFAQDYNVLIKVHPFVYDLVKNNEWLEGALVPDYLDTNYVLQFADVLITDFSSIFVDFLGKDKRIIFFVPNFEKYIEDRGVYDDVDTWPGEVVDNLAQLRETLKSDENEIFINKRQKAINYYLKFDDGNATKQLVETVFDKVKNENVLSVQNDKKNILIYSGAMGFNGITTSFLSLLDNMDYQKYNVFAFIPSKKINETENFNNYQKMNQNVIPLFSFGKNVFNIQENIEDYYYQTYGLEDGIIEPVMLTGYQRESNRLFAKMTFETAIDFNGYAYYWARYIIGTMANKRIIYLHNDMFEDMRKKVDGQYPHFHNVATLLTAYGYFDHYVNVSKAVERENSIKLANTVDTTRMITSPNPILPYKILKRADEEVDWENVRDSHGNKVDFGDNNIIFITSARLSPEKNQSELIKAFATYHKDSLKAKLYILGDGPLYSLLDKLIISLKASNYIKLVGFVDNPMPYIKKSDVFVFPSKYEGQGLSLIEAMVLGQTKILATNIPTSVELLKNGRLGYLTNGTKSEDILDGLKKMSFNNEKTFENFNAVQYNQEAMDAFGHVIND